MADANIDLKKFSLTGSLSKPYIYIYLIRPLLEHVDVVWDNCTQQEANELEKIKMKLLALLREQPNLHQFNLYCLTQGGKVSHREEKSTNSSSSMR